MGWANTASGLDAFAGGNKSVASGASSVALGDAAQATGDLSTAIGAQARATGANSVALGSGSVATDANTVSVGSSTQQRRITNVMDGIAPSDVATVGQLNGLDGRLNVLNGRLNAVTHRADAGAAAAMAVAGLPQAFRPGKGMIGVAIGHWRGETAFAIGASKVFDDGHTVFRAGATFDHRGSGSANAGIGWQF